MGQNAIEQSIMESSFSSNWKKLWADNRIFFAGFVIFLILGGAVLAMLNQGDDILFINRHRTPFSDVFFRAFTKLGEVYVYLPVLLLLLFYRYRYALSVPLLGISVLALSFGFKSLFAHDRPLAFFRKLGLLDQLHFVQGVRVNGGATSFPSGHTMSAFAIFAFMAFCLPQKKWVGAILLLVALLVGFSRIYLIQHFFEDVYFGAILGVLVAMIWYWLQFSILPFPSSRLDGNLNAEKIKPTPHA